jgi:hypothetical protein
MAEPNKVTVRVEVVVEGAGAAPVVTVQKERPPFRAIDSPQPSPADTPVTQVGGVNYIAASGGSQVIANHFPRRVWALAYSNPNEDPLDHPFPDPGAVSDTPGGGGAWSFSAAKGNLVPGAACDPVSGGPNNSTLIVWFDYGSASSPDYAVVASTPFHGYCPASGLSGATSGVSGPGFALLSARLRATVLHATFTGALAPLGTVTLRWNGAAWVGVSTHCGGAALSFLGLETACHLVSAGPGTAFVVAGPPGSFHPFHWSAAGTAVGAVAGRFQVTITE